MKKYEELLGHVGMMDAENLDAAPMLGLELSK